MPDVPVESEDRIRELMLGNLFDVFSEHDPERRNEVIARNYTEDVIWTDPDGIAAGRQAFAEAAQKFVDNTPDFVFTAAGPVMVSRDIGYLPFNLGVPRQAPAASGLDVAVVREGRIALLYTMVATRG